MGSVAAQSRVCQGNPVSLISDEQGNDLSLIRDCLRLAIEESRWKHDALATAMALPNAAYLSNMLSGEKPIGAKHLRALPDDVEAIFARRYAESFGLIVVAPLRGDEAVHSLVRGLIGVLSQAPAISLPNKAGAPLKVKLPQDGLQKRKVSA